MLGLEILQLYTVRYEEKEDRVIATVAGAIAPYDRERLEKIGWTMTGDGTCYFLKEKEPKGSLYETEDYDPPPIKLDYGL